MTANGCKFYEQHVNLLTQCALQVSATAIWMHLPPNLRLVSTGVCKVVEGERPKITEITNDCSKWTLQCLRSCRNFMPNADFCARKRSPSPWKPTNTGNSVGLLIEMSLGRKCLGLFEHPARLPVRCKHKFLIRTNPVRIVYESNLDKGKLEPSYPESTRWTIPGSIRRLYVASLNCWLKVNVCTEVWANFFPSSIHLCVCCGVRRNVSIARVQILCLLLFLSLRIVSDGWILVI